MSTIFFGIADRTFVFDRTVGRAEFSGSGFRAPMDVAIAPDGRIYVANRSWEYRPDGVRVTMLTVDEDYIGQFGSYGDGDGQMIWPSSVAVDSNQNVYVTDDHLNRVSVFDKDGQFLHKWGEAGSGDGQLNQPYCIRFDKDDNAYVSDSGNNRIQKFSKDGRFISKFGQQGSRAGELNLPWGLTVGGDGSVYVADWGNDRVQKFASDGEHLASYGGAGRGDGEFSRPSGVAVDAAGYIYVADWGNERVQILDPNGGFVQKLRGEATLSAWAANFLSVNVEEGEARSRANLEPEIAYFVDEPHEESSHIEKYFWSPVSVKLDREGNLYVTESNRHRIQVYRPGAKGG